MTLITSESGKRMISYLPAYYETSRVLGAILQAQGAEMDQLKQALTETLDQFFVNSATWGLDAWEAELGIASSPDKPDDQRRAVINSKLRGVGTVTIELIRSISEAYDRGRVEVSQQPAMYQFTVKFIDTLGTPPNLADLKAAIEEIKPAHLNVVYQYKYLLLNQIHQTITINEIEQRMMTDFAPFIPA